MDLIGQVMNIGPYASAPRVFVIADNGSNHRGRVDEIFFFSIIQKKAISPNDFASPGELSATLLAFIDRYNQAARPFNWNYTATDLARYLGRINGQQQPATCQRPHDQPPTTYGVTR